MKKLIVITLNILCVHRNYAGYKKNTQLLILLKILLEICLIIANIVIRIILYPFIQLIDILYFYLITGMSLFIILSALYNANNWKKLASHFQAFSTPFPADAVSKTTWIGKKILLFWIVIYYIVISICGYYFQTGKPHSVKVYLVLSLININMCDFRFVFEFFTISCCLDLITEQLDSIMRDMDREIMKNPDEFCRTASVRRFNILLDKWSAAYATTKKCIKLCSQIFGLQIVLMVFTIAVYYILIMYEITSVSVRGGFTPLLQFLYIISLSEFLIALFVLSRAAQRSLNSADALRRRLSLLLVHSLGCTSENQYKATKDLLRFVSTHPIQTQAFGSIDVDMSLLPSCIALCASYTVIALQFNNVL